MIVAGSVFILATCLLGVWIGGEIRRVATNTSSELTADLADGAAILDLL